MNDDAAGLARMMNQNLGGWNKAMGLRFTSASPDEVIAELDVAECHLQPYGIIHGGVYAGVIETLCSSGAALFALQNGQSVVGIENHTSFLRAVRGGRLHIRALPLQRGRRAQVWEGSVRDDRDRLVASGRVRLLCLEQGAALAGETVAVKG